MLAVHHWTKVAVGFFLLFGTSGAFAADTEFNAYFSHFPPYEYTDENDEPQGLTVEVLKAVLERANLAPATLEKVPWARAYQTLQEQPNTLVFTVTRTEEREDLFLWVGPLSRREFYFYRLQSRPDVAADSIEDAKRYVTGTVREFSSEKYLVGLGFEIGKNLSQSTDQDQNIRKLFRERVDLIVSSPQLLAYSLRQPELVSEGFSLEQLQQAALLNDRYSYYFAWNKETDPLLFERFAAAFDALEREGEIERIRNRYLQ